MDGFFLFLSGFASGGLFVFLVINYAVKSKNRAEF
jgi:hypothetical protein